MCSMTGWIFQVLPNFFIFILLDAFTNTHFGLRKSKDGDKAENITKKKYIFIYFLLEVE